MRAPIVGCQYVPFCAATDSPLLLATSRAGALALLRVHEVRHGVHACSCVRAWVRGRQPAAFRSVPCTPALDP